MLKVRNSKYNTSYDKRIVDTNQFPYKVILLQVNGCYISLSMHISLMTGEHLIPTFKLLMPIIAHALFS